MFILTTRRLVGDVHFSALYRYDCIEVDNVPRKQLILSFADGGVMPGWFRWWSDASS